MDDGKLYPARFDIEYQPQLDRLTTFFRLIWAIPILIILGLLSGSGSVHYVNEAGQMIRTSAGGISGGLFVATALILVFRRHYPRWWFDFALEFGRFGARVGAYLLLLTDRYPSTVDAQAVKLDVAYPDVQRDLDQYQPLFKWLLALPHYVVLAVLSVGVAFVTVLAWLIILFTGSYPRPLFDFVVGVGRWWVRVWAYAFLLTTDLYPPFSLE